MKHIILLSAIFFLQVSANSGHWIFPTKHPFFLSKEGNFSNTRISCGDQDADLAIFDSPEEIKKVLKELNEIKPISSIDLYIGYKWIETQSCQYPARLDNGKPIDDSIQEKFLRKIPGTNQHAIVLRTWSTPNISYNLDFVDEQTINLGLCRINGFYHILNSKITWSIFGGVMGIIILLVILWMTKFCIRYYNGCKRREPENTDVKLPRIEVQQKDEDTTRL